MRDKKLIKNIISGETECVDQLMQCYYNDIYIYCYTHLNDKYLAQDITQEVFLKFLQNINSYLHTGKLKHYLYIIAKNLIRDYGKKKKKF